MLDGKEMCGIEDKAVSTSDDPLMNCNANSDSYYNERVQWNIVTVEKLITTLINTKMISLRAMESMESFDPYYDSSESSSYSLRGSREKLPPDKKRSRDQHRHSSHHRHHHRHCSKHSKREEQYEQRSSISKCQKWSDDLDIETSFINRGLDEEMSQDRSSSRKLKPPKDGSILVEMEPKTPPKKRKRKKRRKRQLKKVSQIDPEDLPKRARWTIIITSGLLILTCMFLVGITLRMAPVIDQMVRTKNEELMNSLNRESNPAYYSSFGWGKPYADTETDDKEKYE